MNHQQSPCPPVVAYNLNIANIISFVLFFMRIQTLTLFRVTEECGNKGTNKQKGIHMSTCSTVVTQDYLIVGCFQIKAPWPGIYGQSKVNVPPEIQNTPKVESSVFGPLSSFPVNFIKICSFPVILLKGNPANVGCHTICFGGGDNATQFKVWKGPNGSKNPMKDQSFSCVALIEI